MRTFIAAFLLAASCAGAAYGQAITVTVEKIPPAVEDLAILRDGIARTPEGGAVIFLLAMQMYAERKDLGLQAMTLALDAEELVPGDAYKGFRPSRSWDDRLRQLEKYPFLGRIYVKGTKAEDSYALPPGPLVFSFTEVRILPDGTAKVFAATASGNMPRPIGLRKNDKGLWKAIEASSVFVGPSLLPPEKRRDEL